MVKRAEPRKPSFAQPELVDAAWAMEHDKNPGVLDRLAQEKEGDQQRRHISKDARAGMETVLGSENR